jgi:hypothetical protein
MVNKILFKISYNKDSFETHAYEYSKIYKFSTILKIKKNKWYYQLEVSKDKYIKIYPYFYEKDIQYFLEILEKENKERRCSR